MKVRRFEEIQAQTGMSSHLLANRLKRLEQDGIIERRVYSSRPLRHEYFATEKGRDLDAVMLALRNWDLRWGGSDGKGAAAMNLTDKESGSPIDGTWHNPSGKTFSFANTTSVMSEAWKAEREANAAAFYAAKKTSPPTKAAKKTARVKQASPSKAAKKTAGAKQASPSKAAVKTASKTKATASGATKTISRRAAPKTKVQSRARQS